MNVKSSRTFVLSSIGGWLVRGAWWNVSCPVWTQFYIPSQYCSDPRLLDADGHFLKGAFIYIMMATIELN